MVSTLKSSEAVYLNPEDSTNLWNLPKKAASKIFECLTFNELSATMRVSRQWKAVADQARASCVHRGMNAGFLYRLTDASSMDSGYLYLTRQNSAAGNVLHRNPLLRAAFNKAQVVAFNACEMLEPASLEPIFTKLAEVPDLIKAKLSPERIQTLNQRLWQALEKKLSLGKFNQLKAMTVEKDLSPEKRVCLAIFALMNLEKSEQFNPVLSLLEASKSVYKPIIDLSAGDPGQNDAVVAYNFLFELFKTDEGLDMLLYPFESDLESLDKMKAGYEQGWIHGHDSLYTSTSWPHKKTTEVGRIAEEDPERELIIKRLLENQQKLKDLVQEMERAHEATLKKVQQSTTKEDRQQIQEESEKLSAELEHQISQVIKTIENDAEKEKVYSRKLKAQITELQLELEKSRRAREEHEKLSYLFSKWTDKLSDQVVGVLNQSPLIVIYSSATDVIPSLKARGIEILGPLRAPLKPRGFVWELIDPQGRTGTLVGSMHITPTSLLNFNSTFLRRFDEARVLAVEVDVTRDEVSEAMSKMRDEYFWTEIYALSEAERNNLFTIFKELISLPSLKAMDNVPQGRDEFLLWAVKQIGPYLCCQLKIGYGIDFKLIEMAKGRQMPIEDLESMELHVASKEAPTYFSFFGKREFLSELSKMSLHKAQQMFDQIKTQAKADLIDKMVKMMEFGLVEELENSELTRQRTSQDREQMIKRNYAMAASVDRLISSGKNPFCVVGAAHAVREGSVLELLRQKGYFIRQVLSEEPEIPLLLKMCSRI